MTKAELIELSQLRGVEGIGNSMKKADIIRALKDFEKAGAADADA